MVVMVMVMGWWGVGAGTCRREKRRAVGAVGRCGATVWGCGESWIDGRIGARRIVGGGRAGGNGGSIGWE